MTVIPNHPDLRRTIFKPGDRVVTGYTSAIGTVQPYPKDAATIEVVFDGEQVAVVFYVEELHQLRLVEPAPAAETTEAEVPAPDHASSAYLAAANLLYLTEFLDRHHDVCLSIGWDGYGGRETTLHVDADAGFAVAAALATRIGLAGYKSREFKGDVHHRWTGDRHGLPVRVVWIDRAAAGWHPEVQA